MKQEIHFVTGKGGVGKSVLAAALALKKSKKGERVLLVELGHQSFYRDFFDLQRVDYAPTELKPNLFVSLWTGDSCLQEYARHLIKVESLAKLFFENQIMRAFVNVAPGLAELAILGKITSTPRQHGPLLNFDSIIVDAYATGHFLSMLSAPMGMAKAVQLGPMGEQSRAIDRCIRDSELCKYHIVTLPEELPIKEALELEANLSKEFSVKADIILNKTLQPQVTAGVLDSVKKENSELSSFASFLEYQLQHQNDLKMKLEKASVPYKEIPLCFEVDPWSLVEKVAEALK